MAKQKYTLRYLPLFYDEFGEKIDYIADKLLNPKAANDLIDAEGEDKIMEVRRFLYEGQDSNNLI